MFKYIFLFLITIFSCGIVCAFSNSLDGSQSTSLKQNNNFSTPNNSTYKNNLSSPLNKKEHAGFTHQDRQFPNPTMNDTRYNSNCQFGQCLPGGLNKNE